MIRNLKVLGLALVAVFAMSAMAASGASAQTNGKFTSDGPATLDGVNTGEELENSLTAFGQETTCPNATYTGHEVGSLTNGVPNNAGSATITPHYGLCNTTPGFRTTVDMNECDYVFHLGETTPVPGNDEYFINSTVECDEGKHIVITLFTNATQHAENKPFCNITVTEEEKTYTGLKARDTTNGTIDITGTIEGITVDKKKNTLDNGILCPEKNNETSILHIDVSVTGKNASGGATGIGISH
jgi:hypothetical protein